MSQDFEDFEFALYDRFGALREQSPAATPRAMAATIAAQRPQRPSQVSLTVRAFNQIRAALRLQSGVDPTTITPRTHCCDLMPDITQRRAEWQKLRAVLGIREAPRLERPAQLTWTLLCIAGVIGVVGGAVAPFQYAGAFSVPRALLTGVCATLVCFRLTRRWARCFEPADLTIGTLAHYAVAYGSPILGDVAMPVTAAQTLEVVQALARFEIGVPMVDPDTPWEELEFLARAS